MTIKMNESADENVYVEFQHSKPYECSINRSCNLFF